MPRGSPPPSPLLVAAEALDAQLRRFETQVALATRDRLASARELERTAAALGQIPGIELELRARVDALLGALDGARRSQEQQAAQVEARASELRERATCFDELSAAYSSLGERTRQLSSDGRELGARVRGAAPGDPAALQAGLSAIGERVGELIESAHALEEDARSAGFGDLSTAVDALRQQLLSVRNHIGLARSRARDGT